MADPSSPIILIEDDPTIGAILHEALAEEGYEVAWYELGRRGLEAARSARAAIVLLDLGLPDIDGREILRDLKDENRQAGIKVVVVSANTRQLTAAEQSLADEVIAKPFDVARIFLVIDRLRGGG